MLYRIFSLQNFPQNSSAFTAFASSLPEEKVILVSQEEIKPFKSPVMNLPWRQVNPFLNCCTNKTTAALESHVNRRLYKHQLRLARAAKVNDQFSELKVPPRKEEGAWWADSLNAPSKPDFMKESTSNDFLYCWGLKFLSKSG